MIGGIVALVLAAFGLAVYRLAEDNLSGAVDSELRRRANGIEVAWNRVGSRFFENPSLGSRAPLSRQPNPVRRALFSGAFDLPRFFLKGRKPLFQGGPPWSPSAVDRAWKGTPTLETVGQDDEAHRVLTRPLRLEGQVRGVVQLGVSLQDAQAELDRLGAALMAMVPIAGIASALVAVLLSRIALRPVGRLAAAAEGIEARRLSERLPAEGNDEIADLSRTFNRVLERLEKSFEAQRKFTADASHELKTPLTAIKLRAEITRSQPRSREQYEEALASILQSASSMAQTVEEMLTLAQSDEGVLDLRRERVALADIAAQALGELPAGGGPPVSLETLAQPTVSGDGVLLVRMVRNLVENAVRHTPKEGSVTVRISREGDSALLEVSDTGVGIPSEDLPHIFQRFYRVDRARTRDRGGSGLGLALVDEVVRLHGGRIEVESALGRGTTFRAMFPKESDP
jgi:heavy metal sensor kinase